MVYYVGGRGKSGNILEQKQYNMLEMVQFEYLRYKNPCVSSIFGEFPFLIFHSLG